ncbi:DUF6968 family protein [Brevundimonas sp.]|uniref:DUF6968 family protein n=1 Tax=Brevundimonas sp. TaxID=1871086 RepID=UPI002D3E3D89|nr:hypothetical protein [Brevundimonas sp.]HYC74515.1 hypothetical protein [Brevundimonas sp.]
MSDLVCDRQFGVEVDGVERRVVVEWMRPVRDRGDWRCDWVIHWFDRPEARGFSMGVDSTQALLLAMGMAGVRIEHDAPTARWLDGDSGLGLPPIPAGPAPGDAAG